MLSQLTYLRRFRQDITIPVSLIVFAMNQFLLVVELSLVERGIQVDFFVIGQFLAENNCDHNEHVIIVVNSEVASPYLAGE